jgi:hypothetical protein
VANHKLNASSSRSHAILVLRVNGEAVQVGPIRTHVESAWTSALETKIWTSVFNFCFQFKWRRYTTARNPRRGGTRRAS